MEILQRDVLLCLGSLYGSFSLTNLLAHLVDGILRLLVTDLHLYPFYLG